MEALKGYVMCALLASAVAGIMKNISSGMRNFEKYIGFVSSLVVVLMLASPLVTIIADISGSLGEADKPLLGEDNGENEDSIEAEELISNFYMECIERSVTSTISSRFSIPSDSFSVEALEDEQNEKRGVLEKVIVHLYIDCDSEKIENYLENTLSIKTEIRSEIS